MVAARRLVGGDLAIPGWLLLAALVTILAGTVETGWQQKLRHDADHPQLETAQTAVQRLDGGALPTAVVGSQRVDLVTSRDPWITVTDSSGLPLASSGDLFGLPPIPPSGVFDYVRAHGHDQITWQPAEGVRHAIVVDRYRGGFVVAGRTRTPCCVGSFSAGSPASPPSPADGRCFTVAAPPETWPGRRG